MPASGYDRIFDNTPRLSAILDVEHLDGPIKMEFRGPDWASSRAFVGATNELPGAEALGAFFDPAFAARVTTLRISAHLEFIMPLFAELPVCRTLEILLENYAGLPSQFGKDMAPLRLPALESLAVRAVRCGVGRLSAVQLSAYLIALVGHTGQRPTLRLEHVSLADSSSSLSHAFNLE